MALTATIIGAIPGPSPDPIPVADRLITVGSVSALRALPGASTQSVILDDGGRSGTFIWRTDSGTDDDGTRYNAGGFGSSQAGWQRVFEPPLNVRWFNATGDGATDDTTAIQRALTVAATGIASGRVFVPPGTYKTTAALIVATNVELTGAGEQSYINAVLPSTNTRAIGVSTSTLSNCTISNLKIAGTFSRGIDVAVTSGSNIRIERCTITGHTAYAAGVTLAAVRIGGLDDVWISGNVISGGGYDNGDGTGQGYDILKDSGTARSRIHINDNRITSDKTIISVALFDVADSEVRGNFVDQGNTAFGDGTPYEYGYGISLYATSAQTTTRRNSVSGNHVTNCAGMGIYLATPFETTVVGNVVLDTCKQITEPSLPLAGISANQGGGVVITGNTVVTSGKHGIAFTAASSTIANNYIEDMAVSAAVNVDGAAHRSAIAGNTMVDTYHGVLLTGVSASQLAIIGNTMTDLLGAGLSVQPSATLADSVVSGNTVSGTPLGLYLANGTNNILSANTVSTSGSWGIQVISNNNTIADNVVRGAVADGGIEVQGNYCRVTGNVATGNAGTQISITGTNALRERNRTNATGAYEDMVGTLVALGGGAAPTVGTIGGSGPATAGQNSWLRLTDTAGATFWVPVWK